MSLAKSLMMFLNVKGLLGIRLITGFLKKREETENSVKRANGKCICINHIGKNRKLLVLQGCKQNKLFADMCY